MKLTQNEGIFINGATNGSTDRTVLDSTGALYGNGIYARSGSTAVQVATSTGGVMGSVLSYNNVIANEVVDSSGNITVNGVIFNASTANNIIDSSGNISVVTSLYGKSTAGHVIIDSSGNINLGSSGVLFATTTVDVIDSSGNYMINGSIFPASTAHTVIDSSGNISLGSSGLMFAGSSSFNVIDSSGNVRANKLYAGSTSLQVASSTGLLYSQNVPVNFVETVAVTSDGASPSTITAYGITYCVPNTTGGDFSTSPRTVVLANPIIGVPKTVRWGSTAANANCFSIDMTSDNGVMDSTGGSSNRFIVFSTLGSQPQVVNLVGITTSVWMVTGVDSTVAGGFEGTADAIRAETVGHAS